MSWQFFAKRRFQNYDIRTAFYQVFVILRIGFCKNRHGLSKVSVKETINRSKFYILRDYDPMYLTKIEGKDG